MSGFARVDILPSSKQHAIVTPKGLVNRGVQGMFEPVACASCHVPQGLVPVDGGFAFVLCDDCFRKYGLQAGMMAMPEEEFWRLKGEVQLEEHGRYLTLEEEIAELKNPDSRMSMLARDRHALTPRSGG